MHRLHYSLQSTLQAISAFESLFRISASHLGIIQGGLRKSLASSNQHTLVHVSSALYDNLYRPGCSSLMSIYLSVTYVDLRGQSSLRNAEKMPLTPLKSVMVCYTRELQGSLQLAIYSTDHLGCEFGQRWMRRFLAAKYLGR
jgi:hypothetical protein